MQTCSRDTAIDKAPRTKLYLNLHRSQIHPGDDYRSAKEVVAESRRARPGGADDGKTRTRRQATGQPVLVDPAAAPREHMKRVCGGVRDAVGLCMCGMVECVSICFTYPFFCLLKHFRLSQ